MYFLTKNKEEIINLNICPSIYLVESTKYSSEKNRDIPTGEWEINIIGNVGQIINIFKKATEERAKLFLELLFERMEDNLITYDQIIKIVNEKYPEETARKEG